MVKIKAGIIGCGTIGSELAKFIDTQVAHMELAAICDAVPQKAKELADNLVKRPAIIDMDRLIDGSELVIEAASKDAAKEIIRKCCDKSRNMLVMSAGAVLEDQSILDHIRKKGIHLYLPSGAIAGLDALKAVRAGEISSVTLTTRKPLKALEGAPFIAQNKIKLEDIKEETLIFEGSAAEAVSAFPANINVAALLSLAGIGPKKTRVRIFASPQLEINMHEIEVAGEFGKFTTRTENLPSPHNPKTSYLAVLSAMAMLRQIADTVRVGT